MSYRHQLTAMNRCAMVTTACLVLQVSAFSLAAEPSAPPRDITKALLAETVWAKSLLPGRWSEVSTLSTAKSRRLIGEVTVFGATPQQVHAYFDGATLQKIELTYLEAGLFFTLPESDDLRRKIDTERDSRERRRLARRLREVEKTEQRELRAERKEFERLFDGLEDSLPARLRDICGRAGKRVSVGQQLRSRVTEFTYRDLVFRLLLEDEQLISLTIMPAAMASRRLLNGNVTSRTERRSQIATNAIEKPNGDIVVTGIPMFNQGGRGYCAMGTLAMITKYYGLDINIDLLAAKAGYRQGNTGNADILPVYNATASEAKLRMTEPAEFDFKDAKKLLRKGQPILVWRAFSRSRDAYHSAFAHSFAEDPTVTLPNPKTERAEKNRWPRLPCDRHASLVTGFNEKRQEVLFTESWGEDNRNRRMRAEEMEATVYRVFLFRP
jgi:hypothetical protein